MPSVVVTALMAQVTKMQLALDSHLAATGEIQNDIRWLKRIMWALLLGVASLWYRK